MGPFSLLSIVDWRGLHRRLGWNEEVILINGSCRVTFVSGHNLEIWHCYGLFDLNNLKLIISVVCLSHMVLFDWCFVHRVNVPLEKIHKNKWNQTDLLFAKRYSKCFLHVLLFRRYSLINGWIFWNHTWKWLLSTY